MKMKSFPVVFVNLVLMVLLTLRSSHASSLTQFCDDLPDGNYLCSSQDSLQVCACSNHLQCNAAQWYDPRVGRCGVSEDLLNRLIQCVNATSNESSPLSQGSLSNACSCDSFEKQLKELKESIAKLNENILYIREVLAGKVATCSSFTPTDTTIALTGTSILSGTTHTRDTTISTAPNATYFLHTATSFDSNGTEIAYTNSTVTPDVVIATTAALCPVGFFVLSGTEGCYQIIPEHLTWEESRARCQKLHPDSHLVAVTDRAQNDAIVAYIKHSFRGTGQCNLTVLSSQTSSGIDDGFFISGQRSISDSCDSNFVWKPTAGAEIEMKFRYWDDGEPNCYGGYETCMHYRCEDDHCRWNDYPCEFQSCPICHIKGI
jgi:hypothetical protein